ALGPASQSLSAQSFRDLRPRPYPAFESPDFRRAVARGTRTRTGQPGPSYWQQRAEYDLAALLDPVTRRLDGRGTVRYHNNSPDTLGTIFFHLHQNLFAPGEVRNRVVPITGGVSLTRVVAQGSTLSATAGPGTGYQVDGTKLAVRLTIPLVPRASAEFEFAWEF
ncbi:MAG: M1 family peptidase, partial [Gemmatimonadota bacterium]